ncbi:MAG TPA: benzoate transporter [Candidatus Accumulibacter sp.]|nr:benzoate transporter [Accumulibacter sp.]HCN69255.1 benzoate transporter [Accumulibacter sp.]HCV13788.1 benzoate transporter [Accumulibacter sp.]
MFRGACCCAVTADAAAFDPRRAAILLIGGDKTGDDRWYNANVPIADRRYEEHLGQLRKEGLIDG